MNLNYAVLLEKTGLNLNDDENKVIKVTHREKLPFCDINALEHFIHECDYENVNWNRVHIALNSIEKQLGGK